tara:strand:- start:229 stop:591 length:363 start_codon:yes stop_codon:yes gene_type:complete
VNHGGTPTVRLQAPSYKACTAVPPVPAFLKLFFQKIFFWEKYYIEARFLHQAPRTALRALFPVFSLEHILLQVDDLVVANPIPSNGVVDGIGVQPEFSGDVCPSHFVLVQGQDLQSHGIG